MIELRHDGPVEAVSEIDLMIRTREGYLLLGSYEITEVEQRGGGWDNYKGATTPIAFEKVTRRKFLVGKRPEDAMTDALRTAEHAQRFARDLEQEKLALEVKLREAESSIKDLQAREAKTQAARDEAEAHRRSMIERFAKSEAVFAELREKYKKLRTEVGEARARELLGE